VELRPGVTTRQAILGRGLLVMIGWALLLNPSVMAIVGACTCGAGAIAGLVAGLALAAQRDRMLLDGLRARVVAAAACAAPFLLVLAALSTGTDQFWPSVSLLLALWCGVSAGVFAPWIMYGTLARAPSLHE
jgi:hypothetical protein